MPDEKRNGTSLAWHFVGDRLRDLSPVPPDGEWLVHDGEVSICRSGLHASFRLLEALELAPGPICCRVEVGGIVDRDYEKLACSRRRILWRVKSDDVLRQFARWCAVQVVDLWDPPLVVMEYLRTGDTRLSEQVRAVSWPLSSEHVDFESLTQCEVCAWSSVKAAARSAAWSATTNASWETAISSAYGASMSAAWAIVWWTGADEDQANTWAVRKANIWSAVRSEQEEKLTEMMESARSSSHEAA